MAQNYERFMKKGDTGEPVRSCVKQDSNGKAPDWTGATVRFQMFQENPAAPPAYTVLLDELGGVELPVDSSGTLRYDWKPGESDVVGRFPAIFQVTDAAGVVESYPREGFMWINVEERG